MAHDLLNDPIIETVLPDGATRTMSLPALFAAWSDGIDLSLRGIRPHQRASMHMFLVQAAAGGMDLAGDGMGVAATEDTWRSRLLAVAPGGAWDLVVDDETLPAILQSPLPRGTTKGFGEYLNPDSFTMLVTAKNHSMKQNIFNAATPWAWACSLVEFQTMSGFSGRDNYGCAKLNGGLGSRPMVAIYPDMRECSRWSRDVTRYIDHLKSSNAEGFSTSGIVATWLRPWDGVDQIAMSELHPAFIEICRRVRLVSGKDGAISALSGTSKAARLAADKALCGRTGDPWAPLDSGGEKILTVSAEGWSLRRLGNLVTPGASSPYRMAPFQMLMPTDKGDMFFHGSVVTGGQGKTEGFHEITVPIPGKAVSGLMARLETRETLGASASLMVADAEKADSCLRRALVTFVKGGIPPSGKVDDGGEAVWIAKFRAATRDRFFPVLWENVGDPERASWRSFLRTESLKLFEEATASLPTRGELFYRAHAVSRRLLEGSLRKVFEPAAPAVAKGGEA